MSTEKFKFTGDTSARLIAIVNFTVIVVALLCSYCFYNIVFTLKLKNFRFIEHVINWLKKYVKASCIGLDQNKITLKCNGLDFLFYF